MMDKKETAQVECGKIFFDSTLVKFSISCCFCQETFEKVIMLMEHLVEDHYFSLNPFDLKSQIEIYEDQENLIKELFMKKREISTEQLDMNEFTTNTLEDIRKEVSEIKNENYQTNFKNTIEIVKDENSTNIEHEPSGALNFGDEECPREENCDTEAEDISLEDQMPELMFKENEDLGDPLLWKCHLCHKILKRKSSKNHLKHFHGREKKLHRCIICNLIFESRNKLWTHRKVHTGQEEYCYKCTHCTKLYKSHLAVREHIRRVHLRLYRHSCSDCDKKFYSIGERDVHEMMIHGKESTKVCHMCGARFVNTQRMNNHIARAHSDVTFDCPKCNKKFKLKQFLVRHLKETHTNKRMFECKPCKSTFKYKRGLRKHNYVVHVGERNLECKLCGKLFPTTSHMSCHMKSHGIPYTRANVIFRK